MISSQPSPVLPTCAGSQQIASVFDLPPGQDPPLSQHPPRRDADLGSEGPTLKYIAQCPLKSARHDFEGTLEVASTSRTRYEDFCDRDSATAASLVRTR